MNAARWPEFAHRVPAASSRFSLGFRLGFSLGFSLGFRLGFRLGLSLGFSVGVICEQGLVCVFVWHR